MQAAVLGVELKISYFSFLKLEFYGVNTPAATGRTKLSNLSRHSTVNP